MSRIGELPPGVRAVAVILAAGSGERLATPDPKAFVELGGRALVRLAADAAARSRFVNALVVVVPAGEHERAAALLEGLDAPFAIVTGGDTRHASVAAALEAIPNGAEIVVCHDAARALAGPELFDVVIDALETSAPRPDAVVPAVGVRDTIKRVQEGRVVGTPPRDELVAAQTPQAFRAEALRAAHRVAADTGATFTDDAAAVEATGGRVLVVPGDEENRKITDEADLRRAAARLVETERGAEGATHG